jgi:hypothetical protein
MTLHELHALLQAAFDNLETVRGNVPEAAGRDTLFAVAEACVAIGKAKALVGRDIDDARATEGAG